MNSLIPPVLGLSSTGTDEVRVTTFSVVLIVLTLILLLIVSFYTLQLVVDLRRRLASQPMSALASAGAEAPRQVEAIAASNIPQEGGEPVPPEVFAAIAAAVHVVYARPCRIVACAPETSDLQELQAWSHAGRLHLHDHRVA
ncbi:MAG: hypothetical protein WC378_11605 [Opitutaceae bacterium]|jgi:hypothetical protein